MFSTLTSTELGNYHFHSHNKKKTEQLKINFFLDPLRTEVIEQTNTPQTGETERQIAICLQSTRRRNPGVEAQSCSQY